MTLRVVHLPVYRDNPYQASLMTEQARRGMEVIDGGAGGRFIGSALKRWKPHILHLHWLHPYMVKATPGSTVRRSVQLLAELSLLRLSGTRIVWTLHNWQSHEAQFAKLEARWVRRVSRQFDAVVAHCRCAAEQARERLALRRGARVEVIPHGSYVGLYPDTMTREQARMELGIPLDAPVVVFVGRVQPYKGLDQLVRAHAQLVEAGKPLTLLIAGKGASDDDWRQIDAALTPASRARFVRFEQFVTPDLMQRFLRAGDAMALPFRNVLSSGSMLLGMSFGLPIIGPRIGCVGEALDEGAGFAYDDNDPDGLRTRLAELVAGVHDTQAVGRRNLGYARAWDWARVAQRHDELYRAIA